MGVFSPAHGIGKSVARMERKMERMHRGEIIRVTGKFSSFWWGFLALFSAAIVATIILFLVNV